MVETTEKRDILSWSRKTTRRRWKWYRQECPRQRRAFDLTVKHFAEYCRRIKTGEPTAWINFAVPPELFWAMDIEPIVYDSFSGQVARMGYGLEYIERAEQYIPDHLCSDNKIHLGLFLSGELPPPTIMVYPSSPCDSNRTALSALAEFAKIPSFVIDLPYFRTIVLLVMWQMN